MTIETLPGAYENSVALADKSRVVFKGLLPIFLGRVASHQAD